MYRGKKVYFSASKEAINRLFECNRLSGEIWNMCLEEAKNHHIQTGKWINKTKLQKVTKGKFSLHSQSIQAVCHKYLNSRNNTHKAKKKGISTARYPYKKKNHFNTKWIVKGFSVEENGKITFSMGRKRQPIVVYASNLPKGDIKEIELCYDHQLYLSVSYDDQKEPVDNKNTNVVGVDMGEIHTFASICENGYSLIITGRKMRSIHRIRNKKLKELQKKMSHCKKGSCQWKKYNRAKQYILSKSERQLRDANHKVTKNFIGWCDSQQVKTIYTGDATSVSKNTKKKKKLSRNNRQKLSNWQVGKIKAYLKYKAESQGMKVLFVNESYTTQTCPVCHARKKPKGRTYNCRCGYERHRDIHGASNILSEQLHGQFSVIPMTKDPTYLRVV